MKSNKFYVYMVCIAAMLAVVVALNITLGCLSSNIANAMSRADTLLSDRLQGEALAEQIEEEGIVLVKNDNNCLPLAEEDVKNGENHQLNVFGWASVDWIGGGAGSGRTVQSFNNYKPKTGLLEALANYKVFSDKGIGCNSQLKEMYLSFCNGRADAARDTLNSHDYESCVLYEPNFADYDEQLLADAKEYSDVALVVLGRITGESNDAPKVQYKYSADTDTSRTYLDISTEEERLLTYVGATYKKVVVIVNSTNAVNLEFMDRIAGLDACLLVGGTGINAANAIPYVLFGKKLAEENGTKKIVSVSPSGRTTDTYVYDFKSNPNYAYAGQDGVSFYQNAPSNAYPNIVKNTSVGEDENYPGVGYLDYAEGIYVGYKWYETADVEGFFDNVDNIYGKCYDGVVQYPFGYGLSYSQFDWNVRNWKVKDGQITVSVEVVNVGDVAAKDVVELYFNPPYNPQNGIEKSAVNLCAFAKTATDVAPGESRLLTLSFDIFDMASYDENREGGKFVLEKGNYEISLRTNSHTLKNVAKGSATFNYVVKSDVVYSSYNGTNGTNEIHNVFDGSGENAFAVDGRETENGINSLWLSRADFKGTFRTEKQSARMWNTLLDKTNTYSAEWAKQDDTEWAQTHSTDVTFGGNFGLLLYENKSFTDFAYFLGNSENFDGVEWETLLNQLTVDEAQNLVSHGHVHEEAVASVGKPKTVSVDGPAQVGSFYQSPICTGYPCATVLAQTWNVELFETLGLSAANEAKSTGRDGWYAPGVNLHRSAFGGRNYEYYSEDSYLSGVACAATVRGALNGGVYTYIKHFIGYDQESYRDGMYCWMTEQTLRETYLSPFKRAIDNGATGLMSSYGRIGGTWSGGNKQLLTNLLRDEWGFKGTVITDYTDHKEYMNGDQMLRAGGDLWMDGDKADGTMLYTDSLAYKAMLRNAAKHILYTWTNAAYMQQQYEQFGEKSVVEYIPTTTFAWWWLVSSVVSVALVGGATALTVLTVKKKRKNVD